MASNVLNVAKMDFIVPGLCETPVDLAPLRARTPAWGDCARVRVRQTRNRVYGPEKSTIQSITGTVQYDAPTVGAKGFVFFTPKVCQKSHTDTHSHSHKHFTHLGGSRTATGAV